VLTVQESGLLGVDEPATRCAPAGRTVPCDAGRTVG